MLTIQGFRAVVTTFTLSLIMFEVATSGEVAAQGAAIPFQPGEVVVLDNNGYTALIVRCYVQNNISKCGVRYGLNGDYGNGEAAVWVDDLIEKQRTARLERGEAPTIAAPGPVPRTNGQARAGLASVGAVKGRQAVATRVPVRAPTTTRIPDGSYTCQTWMGSSYVSLGKVRSVASLLRNAGATFTSATPTAEGVTINYRSASGFSESMDCKRG